MTPFEKFNSIVYFIVNEAVNLPPIASEPSEENLNAAFLAALAQREDSSQAAMDLLRAAAEKPEWKGKGEFYLRGLSLIKNEISEAVNNPSIAEELDRLYDDIGSLQESSNREKVKRLWTLFFPEGIDALTDADLSVKELRKKREVTLSSLNTNPLTSPGGELLFTSNALLTVPVKPLDALDISAELKEKLQPVCREEQRYWYDHPIPVGIDHSMNELIYGLTHLNRAIHFERERGNADSDEKASCVISLSVTHNGLHAIAREYLAGELQAHGETDALNVSVWTEDDTDRFCDEILIPAAKELVGADDTGILKDIFGVDGEYGRHYSFLKAVAPLWQIFYDEEKRGTFKIDLDQIFPQEELVTQSGHSAFEHLSTPLWGAHGRDHAGKEIYFGMIAGALVNEKDIHQGIYTPDVKFKESAIAGDQWAFHSALPQAQSTEAEMMTRYGKEGMPDGQGRCLQRIHVTGGTNGILNEALMRYRPFAPSIVGRAEDQSYLLSVLFDDHEGMLRYVHRDGLIMRHDKEAFAGDAIEAARIGKLIGDYIRILFFSQYAKELPWDYSLIKDEIDPFTGAFVSRLPFTVTFLRFALKAATFFSDGKKEDGRKFISLGASRIINAIDTFIEGDDSIGKIYRREKNGWNIFYDTLEALQQGIADGNKTALAYRKKAAAIIEETFLDV